MALVHALAALKDTYDAILESPDWWDEDLFLYNNDQGDARKDVIVQCALELFEAAYNLLPKASHSALQAAALSLALQAPDLQPHTDRTALQQALSRAFRVKIAAFQEVESFLESAIPMPCVTGQQPQQQQPQQQPQQPQEQQPQQPQENQENQENQEQPGLHLPTGTIQRISGPVSMVYLAPTEHILFGNYRVQLPLIMLFGDVHAAQGDAHQSVEHLCEPCDAPDCRAIYDPVFLKSLDQLAAIHPIDFYTEYAATFWQQNKDEVLFGRFLRDTTKACHQKDLRRHHDYTHQCPTEHIRWHYADPRFMKGTVEYEFFRELSDKSIYHDPIAKKWDTWKASGDPDTQFLWYTHMELISYRSRATPETPAFQAFFSAFVNQLLEPPQRIGVNQETHLLHPVTGDPNPKYTQLMTLWYDYALQSEKKSMLLKELHRLGIPLTRPDAIRFLAVTLLHALARDEEGRPRLARYEEAMYQYPLTVKKYIREHFSHTYTELRRQTYRAKRVRGMKTLPILDELEHAHGAQAMPWLWKAMEYLYQYLFQIEAYFTDLYALLRMMKPAKDSSPPYLAFGFFGASHVLRMSMILQAHPYFYYNVVYAIPYYSTNLTRCLTITESIDLARDLETRATNILQGDPNAPRRLQNYHRVLKEERFQREASRMGDIQMGGKRSDQRGKRSDRGGKRSDQRGKRSSKRSSRGKLSFTRKQKKRQQQKRQHPPSRNRRRAF
jgi:hypothetical protein